MGYPTRLSTADRALVHIEGGLATSVFVLSDAVVMFVFGLPFRSRGLRLRGALESGGRLWARRFAAGWCWSVSGYGSDSCRGRACLRSSEADPGAVHITWGVGVN